MEKISKVVNIENKNVLEDKEMVFDSLIAEELINAFIQDLEEVEFNKEEIDQFLIEVNKYDIESIKGILAMPKELREKNFIKYRQMIDNGETNIKEIVNKIHQISQKNGYTLGYHASKIDIPIENGRWDIKGTDLDDRDNRKMAYYSLDYRDIFRAGRGNKLYIVRAQIGENTTHKLDTSNNWGRADSLSVVHKIDLPKIDRLIEDKFRERNEMPECEREAA